MHSALIQKKRYCVTLDIEAYEDLDVKNLNWDEVLKLEGDERVYATVKDYDELY
jgi:hypothetical protein